MLYPNLAAECARKGIKQKDIARVIDTRRIATVSAKLSGKSPLLIDEAFKIQSAFFPNCTLDYLFQTSSDFNF